MIELLRASGTASPASTDLLGGANILQLLVLAFGGALVVGNGLALVRPPPSPSGDAGGGGQVRAPLRRSVTMIVIGLVAAIWAIASLTA